MTQRGTGITCESVSKRHGGTLAVDEVSLRVSPGELLALLGPSGCGKTSLLRLIAGFDRPERGRIVLGAREVVGEKSFTAPEKRRVGLVFQESALFPHLNVQRNVGYGLSRSERRSGRVGELMEMVGLRGYEARRPSQLSGGEQQRVALARALAPRPHVVLFDEPFANLDATLRSSLREDVRRVLSQEGVTAILVTHDQEEALSIADRVGVMLEGRIVQTGTPLEVYERPLTPAVAKLMGDGNLLPGEYDGGCVRCEFGALPSACPASETGHCNVFVRAEAISMAEKGDGASGVIERSVYFGHDGAALVRTSAGRLVRVRLQAGEQAPVGERVVLRVSGPVMSYPVRGKRPGRTSDDGSS